jgi:hypothetical protein
LIFFQLIWHKCKEKRTFFVLVPEAGRADESGFIALASKQRVVAGTDLGAVKHNVLSHKSIKYRRKS